MSDMTLPSKEVLLALINSANGTSLATNQVTFGEPSVLELDPDGKTTSVTVTAVPGSGYKGFEVVRYDRVDLADVLSISGISPSVVRSTETTVHELLPAINALYGINLSPEEVDDAPIAPFTGELNETVNVDVVVKATSLAYTGSMQVVLRSAEIALADIIVITALDGLTYTAPVEP